METIYKKSDKVYHIQYGWGVVTDIINHDGNKYVQCNFPFGHKQISFSINNKLKNLLSFTEYRLEGFSQERPEELPDKGQIVWVKDEYHSQWTIGHFYKKLGNEYYISISPSLNGWTTKGNQITTINPNENEK